MRLESADSLTLEERLTAQLNGTRESIAVLSQAFEAVQPFLRCASDREIDMVQRLEMCEAKCGEYDVFVKEMRTEFPTVTLLEQRLTERLLGAEDSIGALKEAVEVAALKNDVEEPEIRFTERLESAQYAAQYAAQEASELRERLQGRLSDAEDGIQALKMATFSHQQDLEEVVPPSAIQFPTRDEIEALDEKVEGLQQQVPGLTMRIMGLEVGLCKVTESLEMFAKSFPNDALLEQSVVSTFLGAEENVEGLLTRLAETEDRVARLDKTAEDVVLSLSQSSVVERHEFRLQQAEESLALMQEAIANEDIKTSARLGFIEDDMLRVKSLHATVEQRVSDCLSNMELSTSTSIEGLESKLEVLSNLVAASCEEKTQNTPMTDCVCQDLPQRVAAVEAQIAGLAKSEQDKTPRTAVTESFQDLLQRMAAVETQVAGLAQSEQDLLRRMGAAETQIVGLAKSEQELFEVLASSMDSLSRLETQATKLASFARGKINNDLVSVVPDAEKRPSTPVPPGEGRPLQPPRSHTTRLPSSVPLVAGDLDGASDDQRKFLNEWLRKRNFDARGKSRHQGSSLSSPASPRQGATSPTTPHVPSVVTPREVRNSNTATRSTSQKAGGKPRATVPIVKQVVRRNGSPVTVVRHHSGPSTDGGSVATGGASSSVRRARTPDSPRLEESTSEVSTGVSVDGVSRSKSPWTVVCDNVPSPPCPSEQGTSQQAQTPHATSPRHSSMQVARHRAKASATAHESLAYPMSIKLTGRHTRELMTQ